MESLDLETKTKKAEDAFERIWQNFRLDKARLRNLNEKDKDELKVLMKTIFMSSLSVADVPKEIKIEMSGGLEAAEVEGTVRRVLREEMGNISGLLEELKNRPQDVRVIERGAAKSGIEEEPVVLHQAMFDADMKTNIDDVKVDDGEVRDVRGNLDALRRLNEKRAEGDQHSTNS
jgi:hypothetical protein